MNTNINQENPKQEKLIAVTENLIKFALYVSSSSKSKIISPCSGDDFSADNFSLKELVDNGKTPSFYIIRSNDEIKNDGGKLKRKEEVKVDIFDKSENADIKRLKQHIKGRLPIVEIIDLIDFAFECGIITEISDEGERTFKSFNYSYTEICKAKRVFKFTIGENKSQYLLTFNLEYYDELRRDSKNKVEYARRSAQFIDILVKHIMKNYNILYVSDASINKERSGLQDNLFLAENCVAGDPTERNYLESAGSSSSEIAKNAIQNQVKVLIRYQDNVDGDSFSKDIIDDIYITFDDTAAEKLSYSFFDIEPIESDTVKMDKVAITDDQRENILQIKNFVETREQKYRILDELRKNPSTNFSKVFNQRLKLYKKDEAGIPKVSFTVTPISIYINHILRKVLTYTFTYDVAGSPLNKVSCTYTTTFDPMDKGEFIYTSDGTPNGKPVTKENPLVIAIKSDYLKNPSAPIDACITLLDETVSLWEENKEYYSKYKGAYFHKSLISYIDKNGNKCSPSKRTKDAVPYLKSDLAKCVITGKYAYLDSINFIKITPDRILDKLGNPITTAVGEAEQLVLAGLKRTCPRCGAIWAADVTGWQIYQDRCNVECDIPGVSVFKCCEACRLYKATVEIDGRETSLNIFRDNRGVLFADTDELKNVKKCPLCTHAFIRGRDIDGISNAKNSKYKKCNVCHQYYCYDENGSGGHISKYTDDYYVCHLCKPPSSTTNKEVLQIKPTSFKSNEGDSKARAKVWRKISNKLKAGDRSKNKCFYVTNKEVKDARAVLYGSSYIGMSSEPKSRIENELRVIVKRNNGTRVYYFVCDSKKKYYVLKKISKIIK